MKALNTWAIVTTLLSSPALATYKNSDLIGAWAATSQQVIDGESMVIDALTIYRPNGDLIVSSVISPAKSPCTIIQGQGQWRIENDMLVMDVTIDNGGESTSSKDAIKILNKSMLQTQTSEGELESYSRVMKSEDIAHFQQAKTGCLQERLLSSSNTIRKATSGEKVVSLNGKLSIQLNGHDWLIQSESLLNEKTTIQLLQSNGSFIDFTVTSREMSRNELNDEFDKKSLQLVNGFKKRGIHITESAMKGELFSGSTQLIVGCYDFTADPMLPASQLCLVYGQQLQQNGNAVILDGMSSPENIESIKKIMQTATVK